MCAMSLMPRDQILRRVVSHHPRQRRIGVEQCAGRRRHIDPVDRAFEQLAIALLGEPLLGERVHRRLARGVGIDQGAAEHFGGARDVADLVVRRRLRGSRRPSRRPPARGSRSRSTASGRTVRRTTNSAANIPISTPAVPSTMLCHLASVSVRAKSCDSTCPRRALSSRNSSVTRPISRPSVPSTSLSISAIWRSSRIDIAMIASA